MRPLSKWPFWALVLFGMVATVTLFCAMFAYTLVIPDSEDVVKRRDEREEELRQFREASAPAITFLTLQYRQTGRYPQKLSEIIEDELVRVDPRWWYDCSTSGTECAVGFGDFWRDGFVYYWNSRVNSWRLNEKWD